MIHIAFMVYVVIPMGDTQVGFCAFVKKDTLHAITLVQTSCYGMYFKIDSELAINFILKDIIIMCV